MSKKANMTQRLIPRKLSRRALLKGALGVGIALPWLELMRPRSIRAQSVAAPKRFGIFFSPCGTIPENWRPIQAPRAEPTDFQLSPILEPLEPFKQDLVVLRGMPHRLPPRRRAERRYAVRRFAGLVLRASLHASPSRTRTPTESPARPKIPGCSR